MLHSYLSQPPSTKFECIENQTEEMKIMCFIRSFDKHWKELDVSTMSKCLVIEVLTYLVLVDANDDVIVPVLASPLPRTKWKLRSTDLSLFSNLPTYHLPTSGKETEVVTPLRL